MKIDIAVGRSADTRVWCNEVWHWADLVRRLSAAHRTHETHREFMLMDKQEQGRIKDVGGFIGAYLQGGRRKPEYVLHRQLLTLDLDYAPVDFWFWFELVFAGTEAVLHSTHKHCPENPRYRLIIPLDREVTATEYEPIARKLAEQLNIEFFDPTTYQVNRMMFWPSVSSDGEYEFHHQQGRPLSADALLGEYRNWRDVSEWAFSSQASPLKQHEGAGTRQEDPLEKRGIVGLFCRAYSVREAIDAFLPEVYINPVGDRYTYARGTSANGAVVYEDGRWLYAHQATDPCSGRLVNAWDMVRIHLFGHLDRDPGQGGTQSKSYREMEHFARDQPGVRRQLANETYAQSRRDFESFSTPVETPTAPAALAPVAAATEPEPEEPEQEPEGAPEWMTQLEMDSQQRYLSSAFNMSLILSSDTRLRGRFRYNQFDSRRYIVGSVPWARYSRSPLMVDSDDAGLRNYIETIYGIAAPGKLADALSLEINKNAFNPVVDYLQSLRWDGVPRLERLLVDCFGVEDSLYTREVTRKHMVAGVARAMTPGCKYDTILTLVGVEGSKKSTFIRKIGRDWFSESFNTFQGKDAFEQIQGKWQVEMAEFSAMKRSDVETAKHYISKTEDSYRPAYGRCLETFRRTCVFWGSTNDWEFLTSTTGNRRFWPVVVHPERATVDVFSREFDSMVDQLWAEARFYWEFGESLYLSTEANREAEAMRRQHLRRDSRTGIIEAYLDVPLPEDWESWTMDRRQGYFRLTPEQRPADATRLREEVSAIEVWCECLGKRYDEATRFAVADVHDALRTITSLEWSGEQRYSKTYGRQKTYRIRRGIQY